MRQGCSDSRRAPLFTRSLHFTAVVTSVALVPNGFFVTTSKAPVTTSVALVCVYFMTPPSLLRDGAPLENSLVLRDG